MYALNRWRSSVIVYHLPKFLALLAVLSCRSYKITSYSISKCLRHIQTCLDLIKQLKLFLKNEKYFEQKELFEKLRIIFIIFKILNSFVDALAIRLGVYAFESCFTVFHFPMWPTCQKIEKFSPCIWTSHNKVWVHFNRG